MKIRKWSKKFEFVIANLTKSGEAISNMGLLRFLRSLAMTFFFKHCIKIYFCILLTTITPLSSLYASDPQDTEPPPLKTVEINKNIIQKELPFYRYSIKELIEEVEKNIKKAEQGIKDEALREKNLEKELAIRKHYVEGMYLYKHGKLEEARSEFLKALEISQDPDMEGYIKDSAKWPK